MPAATQMAQRKERELDAKKRSSTACHFEEALRGKIVGQEEAVQAIVRADRQRTVREERTRIARELHDTLLQTFFSALMQLGVALDTLPSNSPVKARLDRVLQLMDQGIKEGQNTIQGLRSSDSRGVDLVRAFSKLQQEIDVQPEANFRVTVIGREQPLRSRIANEVYRIGREALVNALRHSGAKRIELELQYAETGL